VQLLHPQTVAANSSCVSPTPDSHQVRFVLVAPASARLPLDFQKVRCEPSRHAQLVAKMQRFRGSVYVQDGAVDRSHLSLDGRHRVAVDEDSWHLLAVNASEEVQGCVRYCAHGSDARFRDLWVRHSALATCRTWGDAFRKAVEAELQQARQRRVSYVEVGGWAIAPERRCTMEAARTAIATYSLARILGGCLGITTATVRHASSTLLRRIGGSALRTEVGELPAYYDPQYACDMEVLRFDSEDPAPRYQNLVDRLLEDILEVPVVCRHKPRSLWAQACQPARFPAAPASADLWAAQIA